jgi:hypothetical protein
MLAGLVLLVFSAYPGSLRLNPKVRLGRVAWGLARGLQPRSEIRPQDDFWCAPASGPVDPMQTLTVSNALHRNEIEMRFLYAQVRIPTLVAGPLISSLFLPFQPPFTSITVASAAFYSCPQ